MQSLVTNPGPWKMDVSEKLFHMSSCILHFICEYFSVSDYDVS